MQMAHSISCLAAISTTTPEHLPVLQNTIKNYNVHSKKFAYVKINVGNIVSYLSARAHSILLFLSNDWVHWPVSRQLIKSTCHISPI
jgi:hypothetical protein